MHLIRFGCTDLMSSNEPFQNLISNRLRLWDKWPQYNDRAPNEKRAMKVMKLLFNQAKCEADDFNNKHFNLAGDYIAKTT